MVSYSFSVHHCTVLQEPRLVFHSRTNKSHIYRNKLSNKLILVLICCLCFHQHRGRRLSDHPKDGEPHLFITIAVGGDTYILR